MSKNTSIFLPLSLMWFCHLVVDLMIGIFPVYKTLVHLDLAVAGIISGFCAFMGEGMQIFFGSLSDRGYRAWVLFCGVLAVMTSGCLALTTDYALVFILYFVTCLGSGAFHPSAASFVSGLHSSKRSFLLTIFVSGGMFGLAISHMIFTHLFQYSEGAALWLMVPPLLLVGAGVISRCLGQQQRTSSKKHIDFGIIKRFFSQKPMRVLYISQVCNATILWGMIFLLPDLLKSRGYESWITFGAGHFSYVIGAACLMVPAGYFADRFSARTILLCSNFLGACFLYTLLYFPLLSNELTLLLLFLIGGAVGLSNPIAVSLGSRFAPQQKGMVAAFLMGMVWCVSEVIGHSGGGFLSTLFEQDAPAKAIAILGVFLFIGGTALLQLPKSEEAIPALEYA